MFVGGRDAADTGVRLIWKAGTATAKSAITTTLANLVPRRPAKYPELREAELGAAISSSPGLYLGLVP